MATKEEKTSLLKLIGLSDQKIVETLKNEQLTNFFVEIINYVSRIKMKKIAIFYQYSCN